MMTLDAFLVLIAAASLPAAYIFLLSRWIEPECHKTNPQKTNEAAMETSDLVHKPV